MLDKIVLHIPIDSSLVDVREDGRYTVFGCDLLGMDLKCSAMDVYRDEHGEIKHQVLKHDYSKLPTSFTTMSFKFFHESRVFPYVELKCSPAKILQGHNVYGSDWIEQGAREMLGYLMISCPTLYGMLAISEAEVKQLDVTYSSRLKDNQLVDQMLEMFRNLSTQHVRRSTKQVFYENTIYWGSERNKHWQRKIYGKAVEFMKQLAEKQSEAKKNDPSAKRVFQVMSDPKLIDYVQGLLRLEVGVKAYTLKKQGIPTNLFQLIKYQRKNPDFLFDLWNIATKQIFDACSGVGMNMNDQEVHGLLRRVYGTTTKKGNLSYTKADRLYSFYHMLQQVGYDNYKKQIKGNSGAIRMFQMNIKHLIDAGFSRIYLQNLHDSRENRAVPIMELVKFDMTSQLPLDYIEPISMFNWSDLGQSYFEKQLLKVA